MTKNSQEPEPEQVCPPEQGTPLEACPAAACILDPATGVLAVNGALRDLLGFNPAEVAGRGSLAAQCRDWLGRLESDGSAHFEWRFQRAGDCLDLAVTLKRFHHPAGERVFALIHDISPRKRAERALRESDRRIAEAHRIAGIGNWYWNIQTGELGWSDEIYRIFGRAAQEFGSTYEDFLACVHPDDRQAVETAVARALEDRQPYSIEHRALRPDGSTLFVHERGRVEFAGDLPLQMIGTVQDITERRRFTDALNRHAQILAQVRESVISTDMDGRVQTWNNGAERTFGYTEQEALGEPISFLCPPDQQEFLDSQVIRPLQHQGFHEVEVQMQRKSGVCFAALLSLSLLRDDEGKPVGTVGIITDISERKAMQDEMKTLSSALAQTADMVMITDALGTIEYVNPAFEQATGYRGQDLIGGPSNFNNSGRHDKLFFKHLWDIISAGQTYRGILVNKRKDGELYWEEKTITPVLDEAGKISHYVSSGQDISDRIQKEERMEYLAHYDALTGLPNRILLADRLRLAVERARRSNNRVAVLFVDLDRFKSINDILGHAAGDQALKITADRLVGAVRATDTVARISGDEFLVVVEGIRSVDDAEGTARKVLASLQPPISLDSYDFSVTASIGISLYPEHGAEAGLLLKHADLAMYSAKQSGKNNCQVYRSEMSQSVFERLTLEGRLRKAVGERDFYLVYQPQLQISDGQVTAMEALLRWRQPGAEEYSPADFVPVLEETGLILELGEWLLDSAFREAAGWPAGQGLPPRLCVNLSPMQLRQTGLPDMVRDIAAGAGFSLGKLEFEITETVLLERETVTLRNLARLRELGVRFAVDDFGTGYSSLSYLRGLPIDTLKIDRGFIREVTTNPDDAALVRAILAMARALRLQTVAEGVENRAQLRLLGQIQCEFAQGFLFGQPGQVSGLLEQSPNWLIQTPP